MRIANGTRTCGCCEGISVLTPAVVWNRPGLRSLAYRVGTQATFLASMEARLGMGSLARLTTRDPSDASIALCDAWAAVGDVLTFYQERIANEGFLRTATERRSVLELARLVGYHLRPGVAASTFLAFTLDAGNSVVVPAGTRAQSLPAGGGKPQSYETSADLAVRDAWNVIRPRLTRPQTFVREDILVNGKDVYVQGTATRLQVNSALLIDFGVGPFPRQVFRVTDVAVDAAANRTKVSIGPWQPLKAFLQTLADINNPATIGGMLEIPPPPKAAAAPPQSAWSKVLDNVHKGAGATDRANRDKFFEIARKLFDSAKKQGIPPSVVDAVGQWLTDITTMMDTSPEALATITPPKLGDIVTELAKPIAPASLPPRDPAQLGATIGANLGSGADAGLRLLAAATPALKGVLYDALGKATLTKASPVKVYALRVVAHPFGYNAPKMPAYNPDGTPKTPDLWTDWTLDAAESQKVLSLDNRYDEIPQQGYAAILLVKAPEPIVYSTLDATSVDRSAYGISGKTTRIMLEHEWWRKEGPMDAIRMTTTYVQSEELPLAEEPIDDRIHGDTIELGGLYDGLAAGRWLVVSGERADLIGISGFSSSELAMLAGVQQSVDPTFPGDIEHSLLRMANPLAHAYKRDTLTIYGNVVKSTHGETRSDVLGSGNAAVPMQRFALHQSPGELLTYVSAATPSGIQSSLQIRVNGVLWHEVAGFVDAGPRDHIYVTQADDGGVTTSVFGNGVFGSRLPTGTENVRATYRIGIGAAGNVDAGKISQLVTRPLGVTGVVNPLPATGGADRDDRDRARQNVPLETLALDRLVSVRDYADFARTFAGIGKAVARRGIGTGESGVTVTIAGEDDIPIDLTSDVYGNLLRAFADFGDPCEAVALTIRVLRPLVIGAAVRVLADYDWKLVQPKMVTALLETFSFDRRDLGQGVYSSEVIAAICAVPGVDFVDLQVLDAVPATLDPNKLGDLGGSLHLHWQVRVKPNELCYLVASVPETLALSELVL